VYLGAERELFVAPIQRRDKENAEKELIIAAMGFDLRKLHARLHNGRIHKRFLDNDNLIKKHNKEIVLTYA
jgi:hypothetical protein